MKCGRGGLHADESGPLLQSAADRRRDRFASKDSTRLEQFEIDLVTCRS